MTAQLDWIEQCAPVHAPQYLAAIDECLSCYPDYSIGRRADIRVSLLKHRAALLGQCGAGAVIPADVRFRESYTSGRLNIAGQPAQHHAWAISDLYMEMAGGDAATQEQARARAMVGLMMSINEQSPRGRIAP